MMRIREMMRKTSKILLKFGMWELSCNPGARATHSVTHNPKGILGSAAAFDENLNSATRLLGLKNGNHNPGGILLLQLLINTVDVVNAWKKYLVTTLIWPELTIAIK